MREDVCLPILIVLMLMNTYIYERSSSILLFLHRKSPCCEQDSFLTDKIYWLFYCHRFNKLSRQLIYGNCNRNNYLEFRSLEFACQFLSVFRFDSKSLFQWKLQVRLLPKILRFGVRVDELPSVLYWSPGHMFTPLIWTQLKADEEKPHHGSGRDSLAPYNTYCRRSIWKPKMIYPDRVRAIVSCSLFFGL